MSLSPSPSDLVRPPTRPQTFYHHHYHHLDRVGGIKRGIERMTEDIMYRPIPHPNHEIRASPNVHPSRFVNMSTDTYHGNGYIRPEYRSGPYDTEHRNGHGQTGGGARNRLNPKARSFFVSPPKPRKLNHHWLMDRLHTPWVTRYRLSTLHQISVLHRPLDLSEFNLFPMGLYRLKSEHHTIGLPIRVLVLW